MSRKQKLHLHTTFCDGKDTPTELTEEAILRGFDYNLLAVHYFKTEYGIFGFDVNLEKTLKYINEHFRGEGMAFARCYYKTLAEAADYLCAAGFKSKFILTENGFSEVGL